MYKLTLPNGQTVEVSKETYDKVIEEADESKYYNSESKGKIKLADMNDEHLKNALLKSYKRDVINTFESLKAKSLTQVAESLSYISGVANIDGDTHKLLQEANRRKASSFNGMNGATSGSVKWDKVPFIMNYID